MKRLLATAAALATLGLSGGAWAMEHDHDHGAMKMDHGAGHGAMAAAGTPVHTETVSGVTAKFTIQDVKAAMAKHGQKATHHLMVMFTDAATGKALAEGEVKVKVLGPDKGEQVVTPMAMDGGFGADLTLAKPGKYGIMVKSRLKDGTVRSSKFWYEVR